MIYKFIDIKNYEIISKKVYDFVVNKTSIQQQGAVWNNLNINEVLEYVPELSEAFLTMGGHVPTLITIFQVQPKEKISIHIDGGKHARLLCPIKNCAGSYTNFYHVNESNIEKRIVFGPAHGKGIFGHIKNPEDATLIESVELTKPIVFRPWIPHSILTNPNCDQPRLTLTILFEKSLEYMLE